MINIKNIDYHPNKIKRLFRKVNWLFSVYLPKKHDSIVLTRNGKLMFNSKDKTTGRILHVYRNHEFDEMIETVELLKKEGITIGNDSIVVDVGGYIGMSSTAFLLENMFEQSLSFEPSPENFRLLQENIKLNNLEKRLNAFNIALSDEDGYLDFELSEKNYGDNRVQKTKSKGDLGEDKREVIQVPAYTFDNFLNKNKNIDKDKIKFIWMDIQGHEIRFIKGAQNFIKEHKHVPIAMEFWPYGMERSGITKEDTLQTISNLYSYFYILDENNDKNCLKISELKKHYDNNLGSGDGLNILLINK